jgi:hypothetical protein
MPNLEDVLKTGKEDLNQYLFKVMGKLYDVLTVTVSESRKINGTKAGENAFGMMSL